MEAQTAAESPSIYLLIPSYSLNEYLLSIIYALDIGPSTRIHEKGNSWVLPSQGFQHSTRAELSRQKYHIVG